MAHVQIPAKEDVAQFPFHHAGIPTMSEMPSVSLTGEGCEIEQVNPNAFIIKVSQSSEKSLEDIIDFGPLWEAVHNLENLVKFNHSMSELHSEQSHNRDNLKNEHLDRLQSMLSMTEARMNVMTANLVAARELAKYALYGAAFSVVFSLMMGIAIWISKT